MIKNVAQLYDKGLVRDINQDSICINYSNNRGIFIVADGMGGYSEGEKASQTVVRDLESWWLVSVSRENTYDINDFSELCKKRILEINNNLFLDYKIKNSFGGSTVVVLIIQGKYYSILHAGDSRAYLFGKKEDKLLTTDDVWENLPEVKNNISPNDIEENSNKGKLTMSIGAYEKATVHLQIGELSKEDIFLLCSDGIYKYCDYDYIKKIMMRNNCFKGCLQKKMNKIEKEVIKNGAKDNYSALAICASSQEVGF